MSKNNKTYSKQTTEGGLHWWFNIDGSHHTLRLAGNPSIILEYLRKEYDNTIEGDEAYLKLLRIMDKIGEDGLSPFVMYTNELKEMPTKKES